MANQGSRGLRLVVGWVAFLASAAACLAVYSIGFDRLGMTASRTDLDVIAQLEAFQRRVAELSADPAVRPLAFTGDSLVRTSPAAMYRRRPGIPERVDASLRERNEVPRTRVVPLRWGGFSPLENYYLADAIIETGVGSVVISFNLISLSGQWTNQLGRIELSGWLAPERLPATALLPMARFGLTTDKLLLYTGMRSLGAVDIWRWLLTEQSRLNKGPNLLREWVGAVSQRDELQRLKLDAMMPEPKDPQPRPNRHPKSTVEAFYGPALRGIDPDDPMLRVLGAALDRFDSAGVEVMVVVMPVNVEHWRTLDMVGDGAGLKSTIGTLRELAESNGAVLADLHSLLGDTAFRDAHGHYTFFGDVDGTELVAQSLAARIGQWLHPPGRR